MNNENESVMGIEHQQEDCGCLHEKIDVGIFLGDTEHFIRQGEYPVEYLKRLAGVPIAFELEEIVCGKLRPLPDCGSVEIKGGERFVAHPKDGQSS